MTKNQIVEWKVCLPPIEVDHNIIFYQSILEMIGRNEDKYFFRRNMKYFSGEKLNRDLAFADWRPMYQEKNCDEMFTKFNEILKSILDQQAPIQICDSSIKQNKKVTNHGYPRNSKINSRKTSFVQSIQILSKLRCF